jgi:CDP-paratose 2-epimerase
MAQGTHRKILITGGAGFIGSNLAARLLRDTGASVRILDNLSRRGVGLNVQWLRRLAPEGSRLEIVTGDVRNSAQAAAAVQGVTEIYHLAAQVAVTTSVENPIEDFEVNAHGTLNILEAARRSPLRPMVLYTSTNKVYGGLESIPVRPGAHGYCAVDPGFRGVDESMPLDFHSPYGCSKGTADQYVRDYARIYGLPTVVFRMSCICGPRQLGTEDQGWVAHFLYSVLEGRPIRIYGDGQQVRDVLHVADLIDAMQAARRNLDVVRGQVYNLGGGPERAISILKMLDRIEDRTGRTYACTYSAVRPGDQPLYITDHSKLSRDTGWHPQRSIDQTLLDIEAFWREHRDVIHANGDRATYAQTEALEAAEVA